MKKEIINKELQNIIEKISIRKNYDGVKSQSVDLYKLSIFLYENIYQKKYKCVIGNSGKCIYCGK